MQRQGFAELRIKGPARPQSINPLAHEATAAKAGITRGHQHGPAAHLPQQQAPLQQSQRWLLFSAGQTNGTGSDLIGMGGQLLIGTLQAETAPKQ